MSKLATVQAFRDSDPQRLQIKTVAALQAQIQDLANMLGASSQQIQTQIQTLAQVLSQAAESRKDLSPKVTNLDQRLAILEPRLADLATRIDQQSIDMAVILEPLLSLLQTALKQQSQMNQRLDLIEKAVTAPRR